MDSKSSRILKTCMHLLIFFSLILITCFAFGQSRALKSARHKNALNKKNVQRSSANKNSKQEAKKQEKKSTNVPQKKQSLFSPFMEQDLSQSQRSKLRNLIKEYWKQLKEFSQSRKDGTVIPQEERNKQADKLKQEAYSKALEILTPEQRLNLLKNTPSTDNPLGEKCGKIISKNLYKQINTTASKATLKSLLSPNLIDNVVNPTGNICDDETFVRRVYVDLTGNTPEVEDIISFLNDRRPDKRAILIDELMETPEFATYQTMHWCDTLRVKSEFPIKLWPNGTNVYHRWIEESIRENKNFDVFARELLTSSGSNFRNPPVNFYRSAQSTDKEDIASIVALTFLGSRFENWSEDHQKEFCKFFDNIAFKRTAEWKEEIVYWDRQEPESTIASVPNSLKIVLTSERDPRKDFADWLIKDYSLYFAKVAVNRYWYWLFGEGIVNEPDDFRADNPPSNTELLFTLASEFINSDYDVKKLYRLILTSRTYQQESPHYPIRPLDAETVQDTLCRIFGTHVSYYSAVPEPFSFYPKYLSTKSVPDGTISNPLLQTFGRPSRDTGKESDRSRNSTKEQRMLLINSTEINEWIQDNSLLKILPLDNSNRKATLQYIWLNVLSRYPTLEELRKAEIAIASNKESKRNALQDLTWMLINTKEFPLRH